MNAGIVTNCANSPSLMRTSPEMYKGMVDLANKGISVFPCSLKKTPLIPKTLGGHGHKDATTNLSIIDEWCSEWNIPTIGMNCEKSEQIVIEFDDSESHELFLEKYPESKNTQIVISPRGLPHYHFKARGLNIKSKNGQLKGFPGVDVKAKGGYVIMPPSTSYKGRYTYGNDLEPIDLPETIEDLLMESGFIVGINANSSKKLDITAGEFIEAYYKNNPNETSFEQERAQKIYCDLTQEFISVLSMSKSKKLKNGSECGRHDFIMKGARDFRDGYIRYKTAYDYILKLRDYLIAVNPKDREISDSEAISTLDFAYAQKMISKRVRCGIYNLTDSGNAERFADRYRDDVRYCEKFKTWYYWDGHIWKASESEIFNRCIETIRSINIGELLIGIDDEAEQKKIANFVRKSENTNNIYAMMDAASKIKFLIIEPEDFDRNRYLINCRNGVYDLEHGTFTGHENSLCKGQFHTKMINASYDKNAPEPKKFKEFLYQITEDKDKYEYLIRWLGYCLCGDTGEHKVFYWLGEGANGKSTLQEIILALMNDYALTVRPDVFLYDQYGRGDKFGTSDLPGIRAVFTSEVAKGARLNEPLIKTITGDGRLQAEKKFKDAFSFEPQCKITFLTNYMPEMKVLSATIRRTKIVPFTYRVSEDQIKTGLAKEIIATELPGILNVLIEGFSTYKVKGLKESYEPECVKEAVSDYFSELDPLEAFINQYCIKKLTAKALCDQFRNQYCKWLESKNRYASIEKATLTNALKEKKIMQTRSGNARYYTGIALKK